MELEREKETFGAFIRREREAKEIGLREMARKIGVSPTYLSRVERDELAPPAEERVKAIAGILGLDADELLALAGKISSDLTGIIRKQPREMANFLRVARGLTAEDMARLLQQARMAETKSLALKSSARHRAADVFQGKVSP